MSVKPVLLKDFTRIITKGKGKRAIELDGLLSDGNVKLPSTTAIFNMGAATDCMSFKLGYCQAFCNGKHICYALKAERDYYPNVLPYRRRQMSYWFSHDAFEFVSEFLLVNEAKRFCGLPYDALRLNESGDFWTQDCVNKAEEIARMLKRFGIVTYCYTARKDLDFSNVRDLIISGSNFTKPGISNIFKMILKDEKKPKGFGECKMSCKVCNRCLKRGMKTIITQH